MMLLSDLRSSSGSSLKRQSSELLSVLILLVSIVTSMIIGVLYAVPHIKQDKIINVDEKKNFITVESKCSKTCSIQLTEDYPEALPFDYSQLKLNNSYSVFTELFGNARSEILIMDSSSNLRALEYTDDYRKTYAKRGNEIFELLKKRGIQDDIRIRLVDVGGEVDSVKYRDAEELHRLGAIERRTHDTMPMVIQHSKAIIVDSLHSLITSANLDYLSLQQKGELGVLVKNCPCFADDLKQVYNNMWNSAGGSLVVFQSRVPYSHTNRLRIGDTHIHTAISPDIMREPGRDSELGEILRLINEAEKEVHISVMDFVPFFHFVKSNKIMPEITDAVLAAAHRGVRVRIMTMSRHSQYRAKTLKYLKKLAKSSSNIEIKLHSFPYQNIYMDRKSHGKSVLTEKEFLISTSNFTPDYFHADTGLSVVIKEGPKKPLMGMIKEINRRYWYGPYAYDLDFYIRMCSPVPLDKHICDAINSPHADSLRV